MSGVRRFWVYAGSTCAITFVTLVVAANWYAAKYETGEGDDSLAPLFGMFSAAVACLLCVLVVIAVEVTLWVKARSRTGHD